MSARRRIAAAQWRNPHAVRTSTARKTADSLFLGRRLSRKARDGVALGTFSIELPTPGSIALLALAGFDFVVLDMEHSAIDFSALQSLVLAAHAAGIAALVRPCSRSPATIGKLLDMGAHGIMSPHVNTPARAREVVEQTRFPPHGERGFSPLSRFDAHEKPLLALGRSTYLVVQVEGQTGLDNIEEIAAVPGIDAVFIGPYDLALSLGLPPDSPQVARAARRIVSAVPSHVAMGVYVDDPRTCGKWAAQGFRLQCVSFDGRMLSNGARQVISEARRSVEGRSPKRSPGTRK